MAAQGQQSEALRPQEERYEELRRHVLGDWRAAERGGHSHSRTMMIFIGEGMAAWMRAWEEVMPVISEPSSPGENRVGLGSNRAASPSAWSEQAVELPGDLGLARLRNSFS